MIRNSHFRQALQKTAQFLALIALVAACRPKPAVAQTQRQSTMPSSDLGRDNMSRVAASATELKAVLLKDTGLLVELKRWVAKDATDHGQIIGDSDLTDDAIFDRLETDSQFRAIATAMVQKYGYLTPQFNPNSEQGKERQLLAEERSKWLAQSQQEQLAAARQNNRKDLETTRGCDPQYDDDCENESLNSRQRSDAGQQNQRQTGAPSANQSAPSGQPDSRRDEQRNDEQMSIPPSRLIQTSAENGGNFGSSQSGARGVSASSLYGLGESNDQDSSGLMMRALGGASNNSSLDPSRPGFRRR